MSDEQQAELNRRLRLYTMRLGASIEATLDDVPHPSVRRLVAKLAFAPSKELPKKTIRPDPQIVWLVEQFYLALSGPKENIEPLRRLVLTFKEAADIVDDIMDGDVAEGAEVFAGATVTSLLPLATMYASRLGPEAFEVFAKRLFDLPRAVIIEFAPDEEATAESYLEALDSQAAFIIAPLEAAAIAAGGGEQWRMVAYDLGRGMYRLKQLLTDTLQKDRDGTSRFNITRLCSQEEVMEHLRREYLRVRGALDRLPEGKGRDSLELFFSVYTPF